MAQKKAKKRVLIIGSGPSGLVVLKTLLFHKSQAFDPILFEASRFGIGGTFDKRGYENAVLVSSKQLTAFSDYRLPRDAPDHLPLPEYVKYLERYARRFGLDESRPGESWRGEDDIPVGRGWGAVKKGRIMMGVRVIKVQKMKNGKYDVVWSYVNEDGQVDGEQHTVQGVDAVSICTGLHVIPQTPTVPGFDKENLAKNGIKAIHSSQYKERDAFKGKRVAIFGIGETSMDLSYEAIQAGAKEVVVCHRGGFLSFPKVLNDFKVFGVSFEGDLAIDGLITNLFETAYVHPWVARSHIRWFISDFVIKRVLWFLTGTQAGCNQWVGELPPERLGRAYVFLNKSTRAMPYINAPYKPSSRFLETYLHTQYLAPTPLPHQVISLAPWPTSLSSSGQLVFPLLKDLPKERRKEGKRMLSPEVGEVKPDFVVFATGYKQEMGWIEGVDVQGERVREVTLKGDPSISWIGFVRPGVGAIPPISEQQAQWWALLLLGEMEEPKSRPTYRLLARKEARIQYGVDHSTYMSTLAKDMGAAPSLLELWQQYGLKVLVCYSFGAAFTPFYRLVGPNKSPDAMEEIVVGELWETITRRKLAGNLFMGVIPMAFYAMVNLLAYLLEIVWTGLGKPSFGGRIGEIMREDRDESEKKVRWA